MPRLIGSELKYIQEVLHHEFRSSKAGFMVSRFEKAFAEKWGVSHAIAMCNGTATLHAILGSLDVRSGDSVICPSLTMASTSLAVLHAGATPVWCDVALDSWCLDPDKLEELIDERTRAIITVALYGIPPDMDRILQIADAHSIPVIEDDAQCVWGFYKGRLAGTIGKAASFSLQSSKTLTAGEGGVVVTDDSRLADRIREISNLGYPMGSTRERIQHPDAVRHGILGWNYRMSDLQAAVALAQLEDLDYHVNTRKNAAYALSEDCPWLIEQSADYEYKPACWSKAYRMENAPVTWEVFREKFIANGGDPFYACWLPNYKEPVFQKWLSDRDWKEKLCPVAEEVQPNIIAFKTNYDLFDEAIEQGKVLQKTIEECAR